MSNFTTQSKLLFQEHFILKNLKSYLPQYLLQWAGAVVFTIVISAVLKFADIVDYDFTRTFATSILSISITTITFAIPTCMRTIFAAYEEYYSTTIKEILLQRFPITLLTISSFTSLGVSMLIVSGVLGKYIPVHASILFCIMTFWGLVCIYYLFVAIEKLVYFVVKAPGAVLDKLKFNIYQATDLATPAEYDDFRQQLASINDIAATIVQKSTGRDEVIINCLEAFRNIHKQHMEYFQDAHDNTAQKRHLNACRAVLHEMTRVYREAANSKNEHATQAIVDVYCSMVYDACSLGMGYGYITELVAQVEKFQSYAFATMVEEIQEQAATDWFFDLVCRLEDLSTEDSSVPLQYIQVCITRELSASLRRITLDKRENLIDRFLKVSSNADIDFDLDQIGKNWLALLDRAFFIYLNWLIAAKPDGVEKYLTYLKNYSSRSSTVFRGVLCDSHERIDQLLLYESIYEAYSNDNDIVSSASAVNASNSEKGRGADRTALIMGLPSRVDSAKTLSYLVMLNTARMHLSNIMGKYRLSSKIEHSAIDILDNAEDDTLAREWVLAQLCTVGDLKEVVNVAVDDTGRITRQ